MTRLRLATMCVLGTLLTAACGSSTSDPIGGGEGQDASAGGESSASGGGGGRSSSGGSPGSAGGAKATGGRGSGGTGTADDAGTGGTDEDSGSVSSGGKAGSGGSPAAGGSSSAGEHPVPTIYHPGNGETRAANVDIPFSGVAEDPQDGALSGAALVWTSSELGAPIGTGLTFEAALPAGTHVITLTATDGDSNVGTDTITLVIQ